MSNVLAPWLKSKGYGTEDPDRVGNIAACMADLPTKADRSEHARRIQKLHGRNVAEQVVERARQIIQAKREARSRSYGSRRAY